MAWKEIAEVATRDFKVGTKRVADMVVVIVRCMLNRIVWKDKCGQGGCSRGEYSNRLELVMCRGKVMLSLLLE